MEKQTLLVTGGAGYIGSHTVVELLAAGHDVVILDDFSNSSPQVVDRIAEIAGRRPALVEGDSGNRDTLRRLLAQYPVDATIHFAGFKAVGESVAKPLAYYGNNVSGTVVLLECLEEAGARRLVFSSSATVYGDPASVPIREDFPTGPTNPYGRTKWHIEHMLNDLAVASPEWSIGILRYFNPVGAHASGRIGENPRGIPNNLMPFVTQVAVGKRLQLSVFGGDYPTHDGTGVRLHPRRGPGLGPSGRTGEGGGRQGRLDGEPGHRQGLLGAGLRQGLREGQRTAHPLPDRRSPPWRRGAVLRRSVACGRGAGLACAA